MILERIVLENVGVYGGRQEINLEPAPGRPIVLVGALNGSGKTTLLDSLQLAFYGPKARTASRGSTPYREYLTETIHRGADQREGASVTVTFRRTLEGEFVRHEVCRAWRLDEAGGVVESLHVKTDGKPDMVLAQSWSEYIESCLPSSIAHLFFFDGEQIKELAEGQHAAEILGTAIQTLLGLDLVERLEVDLKVLERRKRAEAISTETAAEMDRLQRELDRIDRDQEQLVERIGQLNNQVGLAEKDANQATEAFQREGGDAFERRQQYEAELQKLEKEAAALDGQLREIAAGAAPLLLVEDQIRALVGTLEQDAAGQKALLLLTTLAKRDLELLKHLGAADFPTAQRLKVSAWLEKDRLRRESMVKTPPRFEAPSDLVFEVEHLLQTTLPHVRHELAALTEKRQQLDRQLGQIENQLERVPAAESVARLQKAIAESRARLAAITAERDAANLELAALARHRENICAKLDSLGLADIDERFALEDRGRLLKHSEKVRMTLANFRAAIVRKHTARLESLIFESFQSLLRKSSLIKKLTIDPVTFAVTLTGRDGNVLPFTRLSAGERQLLATSLLWGLARASGRLIPTVIDTPLGRLDSSHRSFLVERYFPVASHQVVLLSTDEEITDGYLKALKPALARTFVLRHDEALGRTMIEEGYFADYETAR